jgi:hypothetical protein
LIGVCQFCGESYYFAVPTFSKLISHLFEFSHVADGQSRELSITIYRFESFLCSSASQNGGVPRKEVVGKSKIMREFVESGGRVFGETGIATLIPQVKLPHIGLVGSALIINVVPDHPQAEAEMQFELPFAPDKFAPGERPA